MKDFSSQNMFSNQRQNPAKILIVCKPKQMSAPIDYIERTTALYDSLGYPGYRWTKTEDPPPWSVVKKPLSSSKVGLIASGGIYVEKQVAFHWKDDLSFRIVDKNTPNSRLRTTHFAYDLADSRIDPNVVFPLETMRELVSQGYIGELSQSAYTFMGGIYSAKSVQETLAPALADRCEEDAVDLVLLVPV